MHAHHFFLPLCDLLYLFGSYGNCSWFTSQLWNQETSTAPEQPGERCLGLISWSCILRGFIIVIVPFLVRHHLANMPLACILEPSRWLCLTFLRGSVWKRCWPRLLSDGIWTNNIASMQRKVQTQNQRIAWICCSPHKQQSSSIFMFSFFNVRGHW